MLAPTGLRWKNLKFPGASAILPAMQPSSETSAGLAFGRFLVFPHRRELLADGDALKIGGRAFDVLLALIEARGAVVDKDALMARVWPGRIVEENALQSQIS
ncbi:hypothetical protein FKO01_62415, partial [Mesorhizobium sp. B2-3-3]